MKKRPFDCVFEYVDKDGIARKGKGRTFLIDNQRLELYPSGVLCGMLHRSLKCLYAWEAEFRFPRALYTVSDDNRKNRWYSRKQLMGIQAAYNLFGRLKGKNRADINKFIGSLHSWFYSIDCPVLKREK